MKIKPLLTLKGAVLTPLISIGLVSSLLVGCSDASEITDSKKEIIGSSEYSVNVPLGTTQSLTTLYSYPNGQTQSQSLEQTIEHYLNQRLSRDLIGQASVDVVLKDDNYNAIISGDSKTVDDYSLQLTTFLSNGEVAASAVQALKKDGKWDDKDWRFFLPLGLSIVNQRSVQLLHFPPDYSLPDQDYLNSKTSQRWEQLLMLNNVTAADVTLFESILDVAPIAAPASAGSTLSDTYSYFEPYVLKMLPLLLDLDEGASEALPIVAYGGPVRDWVKSYYKLTDFGVNTFTQIPITKTNDQLASSTSVNAPILGANHPSYIWYAKDQGRDYALEVMKQDLISACWQASMGDNPKQAGQTVLDSCTTSWDAQPMVVCVNMEIQAFSKTEQEAQKICKSQPAKDAVVGG